MENEFSPSSKWSSYSQAKLKLNPRKTQSKESFKLFIWRYFKTEEKACVDHKAQCDIWFFPVSPVKQVYVCFGFSLTDPFISSADENSESESDSDDRFKGKGSAFNNFQSATVTDLIKVHSAAAARCSCPWPIFSFLNYANSITAELTKFPTQEHECGKQGQNELWGSNKDLATVSYNEEQDLW